MYHFEYSRNIFLLKVKNNTNSKLLDGFLQKGENLSSSALFFHKNVVVRKDYQNVGMDASV